MHPSGRILLCVLLLLCVSCSRFHGIRPATLTFDKVEVHPDSVCFTLHVHSDTQWLELFRRGRHARDFVPAASIFYMLATT